MNPKKNVTVTRGPWSYSSTSGTGIVGCVLHPVRHRFGPDDGYRRDRTGFPLMLRGQLYGHSVLLTDYDDRHAEVDRLGLLYGYTQYHGRNTGSVFVQSRAARRRGWVATDPRYLRAVVAHKAVAGI